MWNEFQNHGLIYPDCTNILIKCEKVHRKQVRKTSFSKAICLANT